ncbi:MUC15 protein, partial [Bucco capensis]|nr:MUC15 protein [Bucco capensis]
VQPTTQSLVLTTATATNASSLSHAASPTASAPEDVSNQPLRSTGGNTLASNVTVAPTDGINNSATNRIPTSSVTFTTSSDFSGVTKSAAAPSTSTVTPSNSRATYSSPSAGLLPSENSSLSITELFPTGISLTSPAGKQDSPTPNFNSSQQTTELNENFSNSSTASSTSKDASEDKTNKGGVIAGVIIGAILGSLLIGLMTYFLCGKERSDSFSHRRLYDDTRNDPVLHLDNSLGPYDTSFGCVTNDNSSRAEKAEEDNRGCPSDGIPMADITPSHPSL